VTLVVPSTKYTSENPLTNIQRGSGITLIAAPEDRRSPWTSDAFVRDEKRFNGFVLMHIATAGALWNGLPKSSLDLVSEQRPQNHDVWLSRLFVSTVLTDQLARRVSAEALRDVANPDFAPDTAPDGTTYISDAEQDEYVRDLVENFFFVNLENGILGYHAYQEKADPNRISVGGWKAIGSFFAFSGRKFVQIPKWALRRIVQAFSKKVQDKLYTDDGMAQVNPEVFIEQLDARDRLIFEGHQQLAQVASDARIKMQAPISKSLVRSTPGLWRNIRTKLFATLDGGLSDDSNGFPRLENDIRPIFRKVGALFPNPEETFSFPEGTELPEGVETTYGWTDMEKAMEVPARFAQWIEAADHIQFETQATLVESDSGLAFLNQQMIELMDVLREVDALELDENGVEKPITIAQATGKASAAALVGKPLRTFAEPAESAESPFGEQSPFVEVLEPEVVEPEAEPAEAEPAGADPFAEQTPFEASPAEETPAEEMPTEEAAKPEAEVIASVPGPKEKKSRSKKAKDADATAGPQVEAELVAESAAEEVAIEAAVVEDPAVEEVVIEEIPAEPEIDVPDLLRQHRALKKEIKEAEAALEGVKTKLEADAAFANARRATLEIFMDWFHTMERSLTWKTRSRMAGERQRAAEHARLLGDAINQVHAPEAGTLIRLRKQFHKGLLITIPTLWLIAGLIVLGAVTGFIGRVFPPLKDSTNDIILWTMVGLFVSCIVAYFSFALAYFVAHGRFIRATDRERQRLENIAEAFKQANAEVARLTELHKQTNDWLELLARGLYRPWKIRDSWLESGLKILDTTTIPLAMSVSQANENDHKSRAILRERAIRTVTQRGWRQLAFEQLVHDVGVVSGKSLDGFSVETLDEDMPHISNGARALMARFDSDPHVLESIAGTYIRPVIEELQTNAMASARPSVVEVNDNPLEVLRIDDDGLETSDQVTKGWDEFLSRSVIRGGGKPNVVMPLSALAIEESQVMSSAPHQDVASVAYVPEHMAHIIEESDKSPGLKARLVTYEGTRVRPIDAVIRIDVVGPIPDSALSLWRNAGALASSVPDIDFEDDNFTVV
jgi:hypothetical protein